MNSATALALRPGTLTTLTFLARAAAMSTFDRPAARYGDEPQRRKGVEHLARERREVVHQDLGIADETDDLVPGRP